jgi:hypothetical protein
MDILWMTIGWIGTTAVAVCCVIAALKCIWTLGLPYAMLRSVEERGWSIFPLIELIPLVFAVIISWAIGLTGWFSPKNLGVAGFVLIALSYFHFVVVLMVAGYIRSRRNHQTLSDTKP